jgi:uncharacterized OB-fold protein
MGPYRLAGHGILTDYVIAHRGPEGFAVPYIQAYIHLDDGPRIYSMLAGVEPSEPTPQLGVAMRMVITPIRRDGRVDLVGWKFVPQTINGK